MVKWSFFKRPAVLKNEDIQANLSAVLEKQAFPFPLVFSQSVRRKKSIGMGLLGNGTLEIRFPIWMVSSDMARFIKEKRRWIKKRGELLMGSKPPNLFEKGNTDINKNDQKRSQSDFVLDQLFKGFLV